MQWIADRWCPAKWKPEVEEMLEGMLHVEGEETVAGDEMKEVDGASEQEGNPLLTSESRSKT